MQRSKNVPPARTGTILCRKALLRAYRVKQAGLELVVYPVQRENSEMQRIQISHNAKIVKLDFIQTKQDNHFVYPATLANFQVSSDLKFVTIARKDLHKFQRGNSNAYLVQEDCTRAN